MARKRKLYVYRLEPDTWQAQAEGEAYVGDGSTELDAVTDALEHAKNVSIDNIVITHSDHPLPRLDNTTCKGVRHDIFVRASGRRFSAVLAPHDGLLQGAEKTRGTAMKAVSALMRDNRHLLRRGNIVHITSGEQPFTVHRIVTSFTGRAYVATLDESVGANMDTTPIEAVIGIIQANPHIVAPSHRLDIFFPDRLQEPEHEFDY